MKKKAVSNLKVYYITTKDMVAALMLRKNKTSVTIKELQDFEYDIIDAFIINKVTGKIKFDAGYLKDFLDNEYNTFTMQDRTISLKPPSGLGYLRHNIVIYMTIDKQKLLGIYEEPKLEKN